MRSTLFSVLCATASALAIASASAADMPMVTKAPVFAPTGPSWTGFYLGVAGGGGAVVHDVGVGFGGASANLNGIGGEGLLGSVYGGFDYQFDPRWVIGVMVDGTFSNIETTANAALGGLGSASASIKADTSWSVLARLGWLSAPNTMWYVLGGYTWQNFSTSASVNNAAGAQIFGLSRDDDTSGFTVGAGVETMFAPNWAARFEYRFTQLDDRTFLGGALSIEPSLHTIRAGVAYKFGGGYFGAPVAAAFSEPARTNWSGFYIGAAGGGGAVVHNVNVAFGGASANLDGIGGEGALGSVFGGYDYQFSPQWVIGVMTDGTFSDIKTTANATLAGVGTASATVKADEAWSVLGRLGWLSSPTTLWYVLGGYTWQNFSTSASAAGGGLALSVSRDDDTSGFTVGGGVESIFAGNWAARLEYRFTQLDEKTFFGGALSIEPSMHTIRAGLSYKFNWGVPWVN